MYWRIALAVTAFLIGIALPSWVTACMVFAIVLLMLSITGDVKNGKEFIFYVFLVMSTVFISVYAAAYSERTTKTTYVLFTTYAYSKNGDGIIVNYDDRDKIRTLLSEDYGYDKYYMLLNDCTPVLKKVYSEYWLFNTSDESSIICGDEAIKEFLDANNTNESITIIDGTLLHN